MAAALYRAMLVHSLDRHSVEWFADGALLVERGRILAYGDYATISQDFPGVPTMDWRDSIIIPGLVDIHAHVAQLSGVGSDRADLLDWLEQVIYPLERCCADDDVAASIADAFFQRALAAGTTTIAAFAPPFESATERCFEVADELGIRAVMGMTLMDMNAPAYLVADSNKLIAATERLATRWHNHRRLHYCITPRFAGSCSFTLLRRCGELASATGLPIQTHLAESRAELELIANLFPESSDYTDVYQRAGLLTDKTILAHCIHLSTTELERLSTASPAIAHCPASNTYLQSGIMPLVEYLDRWNLRVGLGTDIGAGYHASILDEARTAREHAKLRRMSQQTLRVPSHAEAFYLATLGGAIALSLGDEVGNFLPGKAADFVRIRRAPYRTITTTDDALAYVLYAASDSIYATMIEGIPVWQKP